MKQIVGKSFIGSIGFTTSISGMAALAGCNINLILITIIISPILSFFIIYMWLSYDVIQEKKELVKKYEVLEKKFKSLKNERNFLSDNRQGLIEERVNYQREIDLKANKIYYLEKSVEELRLRVIQNERND